MPTEGDIMPVVSTMSMFTAPLNNFTMPQGNLTSYQLTGTSMGAPSYEGILDSLR